MNPDYLSFENYANYKPHDLEYDSDFNADTKINSIYKVKGCGDCLRSGYLYCIKGPFFGIDYNS